MDRASSFVNFAVVQIDWLETDGTQEGLISAHEHPPSVGNYASRGAVPASEKIIEHDAEFYIHRYRESSDVDLRFRVVGRLFRSHGQLVVNTITLIIRSGGW